MSRELNKVAKSKGFEFLLWIMNALKSHYLPPPPHQTRSHYVRQNGLKLCELTERSTNLLNRMTGTENLLTIFWKPVRT